MTRWMLWHRLRNPRHVTVDVWDFRGTGEHRRMCWTCRLTELEREGHGVR